MGSERTMRRVSREDVRNNAKTGGRSGGGNWLNLPKDVRQWDPEKAGKYEIDVIPYVIATESHPDKMGKDTVWWKFPFYVHHKVGSDESSVVCPGSLGKPCPVCKARKNLEKDDYEKNEEAIKALRGQQFVAVNILDPDDKDKRAVICISAGKFVGPLMDELKECPDEDVNFYDVQNGDGRTLVVRFSEESFMGRKYLQASRFDFKEREDMDADLPLETVCFEEVLQVLPFEKIEAMFLQIDPSDSKRGKDKDSDDDKDDDKPAKSESRKSDGKTDKPDADDDKDGGASEWKVGQKVKITVATGKKKGKELVGKILEIDGSEVVVEDDDGDEHAVEADGIEAAGDDKPKADVKPDKKQDKVPAKSESKSDAKPGDKAPAKDDKIAAGDTVKNEEGVEGEVQKVTGDDVKWTDAKGKPHLDDVDDLKLVKKAGAKSGKDKPAGKSESKADKKKTFEVGDDVTWGDGKEGEVVKMHSSGEKVRVKEYDGDECWVPVGDLKLDE